MRIFVYRLHGVWISLLCGSEQIILETDPPFFCFGGRCSDQENAFGFSWIRLFNTGTRIMSYDIKNCCSSKKNYYSHIQVLSLIFYSNSYLKRHLNSYPNLNFCFISVRIQILLDSYSDPTHCDAIYVKKGHARNLYTELIYTLLMTIQSVGNIS
jgi:hypothetical protein